MVPGCGLDEIEIVVRVGLSAIQYRIEALLDIGDVELGLFQEATFHPVNRAVPCLRVASADMSLAQGRFILLQVLRCDRAPAPSWSRYYVPCAGDG